MTGPAGGSASPSMTASPAVAAALQAALDNNRSGVAQPWQDPFTGLGGSVLPMRTFRTTSGLICRDYTVIVAESGGTRTEDGTACRDSDGLWKDAG